jgi:alginate O-acetyltransferase complex protein AlgJ
VSIRRRPFMAAVLSVLLLACLAPAAASTDYARDVGGTFVGADGVLYESAPFVVESPEGDLFYGPDFDIACAFGAGAVRPMQKLTRLARMIEKSGRTVIWTAAPSKTLDERQLDDVRPPHGRCDRRGLREMRRLVDEYQDPNYLPIREALAASRRQVYWRTDPHWTTVGGSIWAKAIAAELDPRLGRRQHYTYGTETAVGILNSMRDIHTPETLETAMPAVRVRSTIAEDSVLPWDGYPQGVTDYAWNSKPARRTWPGRTLIYGDSFTFYALPNLLPLFRHGRFMWIGAVEVDDVVRAIKDSDTIVLEAYQTFMPLGHVLTTKAFRTQVRDALR